MKRIISMFLSVSLCLGLCIPISASATNTSSSFYADNLLTTEDEMPQIITTRSASQSTLQTYSRDNWAQETKQILEEAYSQNVYSITENKDYIIFTFDTPEQIVNDTGYIDHVEYLKPESSLSSAYSKKLTYMYGWGDGYYSLEKKTGKWSAIKDLMLSVAGLSSEISVYTFAISVLGIAANSFAAETPMQAQNTTQYYFLNKIGQVKDPNTGIWGPYAYVGSRRFFYRTLLEKKGSYDHYETLGVKETKPNNERNPSNYDKIEVKLNFDNDSWILSKAEKVYTDGTRVYMDVFGMPKYFSETLP